MARQANTVNWKSFDRITSRLESDVNCHHGWAMWRQEMCNIAVPWEGKCLAAALFGCHITFSELIFDFVKLNSRIKVQWLVCLSFSCTKTYMYTSSTDWPTTVQGSWLSHSAGQMLDFHCCLSRLHTELQQSGPYHQTLKHSTPCVEQSCDVALSNTRFNNDVSYFMNLQGSYHGFVPAFTSDVASNGQSDRQAGPK